MEMMGGCFKMQVLGSLRCSEANGSGGDTIEQVVCCSQFPRGGAPLGSTRSVRRREEWGGHRQEPLRWPTGKAGLAGYAGLALASVGNPTGVFWGVAAASSCPVPGPGMIGQSVEPLSGGVPSTVSGLVSVEDAFALGIGYPWEGRSLPVSEVPDARTSRAQKTRKCS